MKIGAAALAGIVLIMVGLLLYGVADLEFGGWLAVAGMLLAFGAIFAAHAWAWTHDDDSR
jgi:hypothetical protein